MAVLGRLLVSSAERLDLPDLLSIDSYAAGDWKYFLKGIVGSDKPYILKGFDVIDPSNAIGTQSCAIRVSDSVTFYPGSNSGSFFHGLEEGHPQAAPLVPELRKNAINYVYLTFSTFNTSVDTRAFWDPDKDGGVGGEFTQDINTESVLQVQVNVSTGSFPANTIPVAKITVGPVVITAIEDARDLMFRLGSGGINPNPFNTYGWRSLPNGSYARQEPPTQMLAGGVNPFQGADKNILTLKEWMDAIMSKLRELGGTTYWYDDTSSFSIITNFYDAVATAFKSKGKWIHDTATPGLLTWTEDVQIKMTSDPRTYIIRQGSKNLADEQVMWLNQQRNLPFNTTDENVQWINGQPYVNTIGGAVGLFANLSKGDYIKKANDTIDKWIRVEEFYDAVNLGGSTTTAAGARSVRLGSVYLGGTGAEKGRYDKGVYLPADVQVTDRNVAAIAMAGGQFHWLALRSDTIENVGNAVTTNLSVAIDQHDGSTARVTATAHGLVDGDRVTISGTTNFNGTYQVEVETANIFYINVSGGPFADESGTARYAVITTAARVTPYGFQEESSNHGFNSNDTITIAGTTNYNGQFKINVRSNTTFQIPMASAAATETTGTARLARVIVRNEGGVSELVQGEIIDIGGSAVDNIRQYIGMQSLSETAPSYNIPPSYNTLDGMANYNGVINENLTVRIAKLTAMMADKAQDKTVKFLPSNGITTITNTANGSAQELRFLPDGASLTIATPSSNGQAFLALPGSVTPLSLLANQAAYVQIDRNNPSTVTMTVTSITNVPLEENTFVIAVRLNTPDIYIWDGSIITVGSQPAPAYLSTVVRQNQMIKLVAGGNWSWANVVPSTPGSIQQLVQDGGNGFTNAFYAGQTFTPGTNFTVNSVNLSLSAASAVGNVFLEVWGTTAGAPNSSSVLGVSNAVNAGSIGVSPAIYNFTFATPVSLTSGTVYALVLRTNGLTSGSVTVRVAGTAPYAGGAAYYANTPGTTGTWTNNGNDWYFDIQGSVPGVGSNPTLTWSAAAAMQVPGLANTVNLIPAGSIILNSGEVAYVDINRVGPGGSLTVNKALNSSLALTTDRFIIAREAGGDVIVGNHSMRLIVGESKKLYAGTSIQNLAFMGAVSEADAAPDYTSNNYVTDGQSLVASISALDANLGTVAGSIRWKTPVANFAALPTSGNLDGDVRLILDQRVAYTWDNAASAWREIGFWKTPVANVAALPTVGNKNGDIRVALDIRLPYSWDSGTSTWKPLNGIGGGTKIIGGGTLSLAVVSGFASGTGFNNTTLDTIVQPDGKIIVGGSFTSYNGTTANRLARLNVDGTIDTAFQANVGTGPDVTPQAIALQADGKILLGSSFTSYNGTAVTSLIRLNANGTLDTSFTPNVDGSVIAIGIQSTGHIIFGGSFTTVGGNSRNKIARVSSAGVDDATWYANHGGYAGPFSFPRAITINSDDTMLIGGEIPFAKHNANGTANTAFNTAIGTSTNNTVYAIGVMADGSAIVAGDFTAFNGTTVGRIAKVSSAGVLDTAFQANVGTGAAGAIWVHHPAIDSLGRITVLGQFGSWNGNTAFGIARLSSTGVFDSAFQANLGTGFNATNGTALSVQSDNKLVVGGNFSLFNGNARGNIVRLQASGLEDPSTSGSVLSFTAPMYIEQKGLAYTDNTIPTSQSPITFSANQQVAYVIPNLTAGGPNLTVVVSSLAAAPLNSVVIARRDDPGVVVDHTRIIAGKTITLDSGVSNQLLSVIPAASEADNTGIARLLANTTANTSVNVTSSSKLVPDGTQYGLQLKNLLMSFTGASINFATGVITDATGGALGINFTPATVASGQYRWYSVTLVPNTVNADNTITGQLVVIPGTADGASAATAPKAAFASTGIKLGQVVVQGNGSGINNIAQTAIVQMGTGGSGAGGTGDANELLERIKDRLIQAPFEWVNANIFATDAQAKVASATASFDVANSLYKFTSAGQNIVSTQSLDPEFLTELRDVTSAELYAFWNPGFIDNAAVYKVSRNGGTTWNTITMSRVGSTTDAFRGILTFPVDTSWSTISEWAVANATAYRELNTTTLRAIAQPLVLTSTVALQQPVLYINKVGSPTGTTHVRLVRDDGTGKPSTAATDRMAEAIVQNVNLATGDNAITLSWGTNVVTAGTYHFVIGTDDTYKAGFSAGFTSVRARVDGTAPLAPQTINEFQTNVWVANAAQSLIYTVNGRTLDLRVRVTSGTANAQMLGYGVFYGRQDAVITGIKNREVQSFNGTTDNFNTFTLSNFIPDGDLLKIYHVETGQVYIPSIGGQVQLNGTQVIFPANTFNGLGTVTLVFDQSIGGSFDGSDQNAALLAGNYLGSTTATLDRSVAGRGIFLRRPDGTLREITIDNNDNIAVYSV